MDRVIGTLARFSTTAALELALSPENGPSEARTYLEHELNLRRRLEGGQQKYELRLGCNTWVGFVTADKEYGIMCPVLDFHGSVFLHRNLTPVVIRAKLESFKLTDKGGSVRLAYLPDRRRKRKSAAQALMDRIKKTLNKDQLAALARRLNAAAS